MPDPEAIPDRIRRSVAAGDYVRARELWEAHSSRLQQEGRTGVLTATRMAETRELLEWTRLRVLALRAHAEDRLAGLRVGAAYVPAGEDAPVRCATRA